MKPRDDIREQLSQDRKQIGHSSFGGIFSLTGNNHIALGGCARTFAL